MAYHREARVCFKRMEKQEMPYTVYILRCADGTLYTGVARDAELRLAAHNSGRGARYTRFRAPSSIVYRERAGSRSQAQGREAAIKKLPRAEKEKLIGAYRAAAPAPALIKELTLQDFAEMADIERLYYDENDISPPENAYAWYCAQPRSTLAVRAEGRICGFVNLFPLKAAVFTDFAAGRINDAHLTAEAIAEDGEQCGMLLSCIAVLPAYRGTGLSLRLIAAAAARYGDGTGAKSILLDAATVAGARTAQRLGMKFRCATDHGTALYEGRYNTFLARLSARAPEKLTMTEE